MSYIWIPGLVILAVIIVAVLCLLWELLQQNGRMLVRLEALETRLEEIECGSIQADGAHATGDRAHRFASHSLANSKIKRDGLKAGTPAPDFRLPRLDGGELSLTGLRGKLVLLVFSSPHCGPCNDLVPELEKIHRRLPQLEMVMISKDEPEENRAKVKEHGLTFPVVLQKHWEISRQYAFFATPVGYLIDSAGTIIADAAVGTDAIQKLAAQAGRMLQQNGEPSELRRPTQLR